jgi:uncharacterized protein
MMQNHHIQIHHPFQFDNDGRTARCISYADHIRDMIEQILFTSPGERVNRPHFGCGVRQLIFSPNDDVQAAAAQVLIQGTLQQELGPLIDVEVVDVQKNDASLRVLVQYTIQPAQQRRTDQFVQGV